jgi:DAK2 domain fusion protein YloV
MQHPPDASAPSPGLDGEALARMLAGAAAALEQEAAALNAINVFPVPDGDTGANMSSTMRAAVDAIADTPGDAASVAKAAAHGALMGAKGNSGVILSQIIGGFAAALDANDAPLLDAPHLDGPALAAAFERGQQAAYHVVSAPREGTILTGITAVALAAAHAADHGDAEQVLAAAVEAARGAAERTPDLLPLLKEAGVVDAGAQGLYIMLDGMLRALRGEAPAPAHDLGAISTAWLAERARLHDDGLRAGYCTEFVVEGDALDAGAIRAHLAPLGESLLVIGDPALVRVHIHTPEPESLFAYARTLGAVSHEKAEDMQAQFEALAGQSAHDAPATASARAIIAVAAGAGIEALFRSLGVARIVPGGQTMNPSAGDIRTAIEASGAREAIVLPNNRNIILAANQALDGLDIRAHVITSASIPQGVAALVAANSEASFDENIAAMEDAIANVLSGEVTLAARSTRIAGIDVREGQPIALVDDHLIAADATIAGAARAAVAHMLAGRGDAIVSLYAGEGVATADAEALAASLREEFSVEVEVIEGGQPHYPYLIGVE